MVFGVFRSYVGSDSLMIGSSLSAYFIYVSAYFIHVSAFNLSFIFPGFLGVVSYQVSIQGSDRATVKVSLTDKDGKCVVSSSGASGVLKVPNVNLWWPYLMHENPGYLYSMEVTKLMWYAHFPLSRAFLSVPVETEYTRWS